MVTYEDFGETTSSLTVAEAFKDQIKGRVIVVTGVSPQSIGQMTAMAFASQAPSQLILASRTPSKLAAVAAEIAAAYPSVPVTTVVVDLSSQQSVRAAAATIAGLTDRVDVLVNNAGATVRRRVWSAERIELQLAANHVGPFLLTNLLLPLLERAASQKGAAAGATRIVNVSSHGHRLSPLRFHDYNFEGRDIPPEEDHFKPLPPAFARTTQDGYPGVVAYGQSKTANILFTVYLQKHLRARGIGSYSLHPGGVVTELGRDHDDELAAAIEKTSKYWKTPDEGASTTMVAALDPALNEPAGLYMDNCHFAPAVAHATSEEAAEKLWHLSEDLVGQKFVIAV